MGACAADEPGCQDARVPGRAFGGRWAQRDGEWIRGGGAGVRQLATSDWEGEHLGRAGGQEGPMREATGNPVPVQGEDARPSYPWSPTLMPDGPISLRPTGSTPRQSTVLKACGSVCLSVSVRPWRSIPFWPSLECLAVCQQEQRTAQVVNQVRLQEQSVRFPSSQITSQAGRTSRQAEGLGRKAACCLLAGRGAG